MHHDVLCNSAKVAFKLHHVGQDTKCRHSPASCTVAPPSMGQPGKAPNTRSSSNLNVNIFVRTQRRDLKVLLDFCTELEKTGRSTQPRAWAAHPPIAPPTRKTFVAGGGRPAVLLSRLSCEPRFISSSNKQKLPDLRFPSLFLHPVKVHYYFDGG